MLRAILARSSGHEQSIMTSIQDSSTYKANEGTLKELTTSQSHAGEVVDVDDRKLKFKIDCWLMPLL